MVCAEFEILLSDYVDHTLEPAQRIALEEHAASCAGCTELMRDVVDAVGFLGRAEQIVAPPALVTRIAYQIPAGRVKEPLERDGFFNRIFGRWLQPVLQPRIAMGMAMTILSFAMLERCTGIQVQHVKPADLNPVRIWDGVEDKIMRGKDRAVKYYENLRLVYEVETRLKELRDQQDASAESARKPANKNDRPAAQRTPPAAATKGGETK